MEEIPPGEPPDRGVPHTIPLQPGSSPPFRPMYRLSPHEYEEMKKHVTDLINKGFIQPSTSPFGAPILFVAKKDNTLRMVVDYRALNKLTIKNKYPLPRIDELLDRMQGCSIFSTLDLHSGYHQIKISDSDIPKTAFRTPLGHYEFRVLPFGLANAPATFQALMHRILNPLSHFCLVYLDDICIMSKSPEEHVQHLDQVLEVLRKNHLFVKLQKCAFCKPEVNFLGFVAGKHGLKVDPRKIDTVTSWPVPKDPHEVRQFLGLTNYFRKFIQGYAALAAPMQELVCKQKQFVWTDACQHSFDDLKQALTSAPVLALPDFTKPFEVVSDASLLGTGAVLMQDGKPLAYTSKRFIPAERNYSTTDQEFLGVIRALTEWRCYLEGSQVTLITDHNPLIHLPSQPMLNRRQARWMEYLSRFEPGLTWEYRPGRSNIADPVSRNPGLHRAAPARTITTDWVDRCRRAYSHDPWFASADNTRLLTMRNGLWLMGNSIAVPDHDSLRLDIINAHHSPSYAGHFGVAKTMHAVARTFWWPGMRKQIGHFVRTCDACQRNKATNQKPAGLLQPLEIPERRWEHVTMDLIVSLPLTSSGHDAIAVFVDKLSKMVHFAPTTSDVDAAGMAKLFLDNIVCLHGLPRKVITDRDRRFTGKLFEALCSMMGIDNTTSTSFHPQTDGQTERANRVLEDMLRNYVCSDHTDWDSHLPIAEFAVNNAYHESVQNTPFFLNYGQHPLTPVTLNTDTHVPSARLFAEQFNHAIKSARNCLQMAQQRQKTYADQNRREVQYKVGQLVLLSTKHFTFKAVGTRKFMPKYIGPFKVLKLAGPVACKLELPSSYNVHSVFHVSLLKPYCSSSTTAAPPPPLDVDADGMPVYEVEQILAHREANHNRRRIYEYLIKWRGYGPEHNSWEPASNIATPETLLTPYWAALGGQPPLSKTRQASKPKSVPRTIPPKPKRSSPQVSTGRKRRGRR